MDITLKLIPIARKPQVEYIEAQYSKKGNNMKYAFSWDEYLLFLFMFALSHSSLHNIPVLYFYFSLFVTLNTDVF